MSAFGLSVYTYQFDSLDVGVQDEFDKFLRERGIDETLALFVPEYAELKEQKVRRDVYHSKVLVNLWARQK